MKKTPVFVALLLIFQLTPTFFKQGCANAANHRLRVGIVRMPTEKDANHRWILIGIEARQNTSAPDLDFQGLGFQGRGMDHLDPKFLLEVDSLGISNVGSFELDSSHSRKKGKSQVFSAGENYLNAFPTLLLNVHDAKGSEIRHWVANIFTFFGKSLGFPIATVTALATVPEKQKENLRELQASYLMELVNKALPPFNLFPELNQALSDTPEESITFLKILGEGLLTRYNPKSNWAGIHVPNNKRGEFYEEWRIAQAGQRSENKSYFVRFASENGLPAVLVDNDFGFALVNSDSLNSMNDTKPDTYRRRFMKLGSEGKTPYDIVKDSALPPGSAPIIPWYLESFINTDGPVDLVNFVSPEKFGKSLHHLAQADLDRAIGGSIIPFSNWIIQGISYGIKNSALEKADTHFLKRIQSYGAVLALTETQAFSSIELKGIAYEQFHKAMEKLRIPSDLQRSLNCPGNSQACLLNDVAALISPEEERFGRLWDQSSDIKTTAEKQVYLDQMRDCFQHSQNNSSVEIAKNSQIPIATTAVADVPQARAHADRNPSNTDSFDKKPIILLLVDGLRPDRFRQAADDGLFPTLKPLFLENRGTELNSFTSRSLTLPSWSTILTGFEPDMHGIRSNTPASRLARKIVDNFQDPRKDILDRKNAVKNRAFRRLEEDQVGEPDKVWLPGYFAKDEAVFNYLPVTNGAHSMVKQLITDLFKSLDKFFNGAGFLAGNLDHASAQSVAQAIRLDEQGKLKFVMIWFAAVDEASHYNNRALPSMYREVDQNSKLILDAAKNHPALKDATVFLLSDHGHNAGYGPFDDNNSLYRASIALSNLAPLNALTAPLSRKSVLSSGSYGTDHGPLLANTGFNIIKFLAGDFKGYEDYHFVVGASDSPEPKFYVRTSKKFQIQPFHETYPKKHGRPTALTDTSGDSLAQVYIHGENDPDWNQRLSFYQLSNYSGNNGNILNIPADFLNFQLLNLMATDSDLAEKILKLTDRHPVDYFTMALAGDEAKTSADHMGAAPDTGPSSREPVLVMTRGKSGGAFRAGLILTRSDWDGSDQFRYIVVKNFTQDANGKIHGSVSTDSEDDPLNYIGNVDGAEISSQWRYDREWLKMAKDHTRPTAIFSLARSLTLAPKYTHPGFHAISDQVKKNRQGEIPDFLITASPGFGFHADAPLESDHGGLQREEVRNTFFVSSLNKDKFTRHIRLETPVLNRDFMPTFLQYAGFGEPGNLPLPKTQGVGFRDLVETANSTSIDQ
ncbi:MAG: alkaline phosphatase family protein [Bdellovibrionia bacterium]